MVKKISFVLFSSLILASCSNTQDATVDTETISIEESVESSSELTQAEWIEQNEEMNSESFSDMSKDSTLSSDVFELEFKQAEVIQSPSEESKGVYLTFDLTNTSEENIVPFEILTQYVTLSQATDTSLVYLANNYYELDAFGEDTENYNKMVDKGNALSNELLPHKTIEVSYAYYLEDESLLLEIYVYGTDADVETDSYIFNLDGSTELLDE